MMAQADLRCCVGPYTLDVLQSWFPHVLHMFQTCFRRKGVNSRSRFTGQFGIALILYFGSGFRDSFWDCFRGLIYVCFRGQF